MKYNSNVKLGPDNFIIRTIGEEFGPSRAGKPMITLEHEIVSPETVNVNGIDYEVAGLTLKTYHVTKSVDEQGNVDPGAQQDTVSRLNELTTAYSLPDISDVDNPTLGFKGKQLWVLISSQENAKTKSPTSEQLKEGKKIGDPIVNPITGKPEVYYRPQIDKFYGLAQTQGAY